MTDKEYMQKVSVIMELIENSKFFNKFGYKHHWQSGTHTVYPITNWVPNRQIVIQLDSKNYRGRTQSAKSLINSIERFLPIKYWGYGNYDGSCPPTLYINFKEK